MKAIPPLKYQANVINHKVAKATEKTMYLSTCRKAFEKNQSQS